eukprot:m.290970 g.290970  ORF g.290970 m.290970 type:complete len:150 (+) comp40721_c1_seq16:2248-2697(+)
MQCPVWANSAQIAEFAHVLSARKFNSEFSQNFLAVQLRKPTKHNVRLLAGKAAEFLLQKFTALYSNCGQAIEIRGKSRQNRTYQLKVRSIKGVCLWDFQQKSLPLRKCYVTMKAVWKVPLLMPLCSVVATVFMLLVYLALWYVPYASHS